MYVEIKTKRLLLRPLRPEDFPDVCQYIGDPENTRFMLFMQADGENRPEDRRAKRNENLP